MAQLDEAVMNIEAELRVPTATTQLVRFDFAEPIDKLTRLEDGYRLDLCLTPRPTNARACYPDHWNSQRFEPLGKLFLWPAGETMHNRSDGCCQQASLVCQLHKDPLSRWFGDELSWTDHRLRDSLDIRDVNIQGLLLRLMQEARHPGIASSTLVELIVGQLAIELTRYCAQHRESTAVGGLSTWRLRLIDERLNEVAETPTLTELSELCRISVRQLTRGFRLSRGCSIGDYIAGYRVEQAKKLLATDQSIKVIAYSLGFASSSSFCYAFRRAAGETPRQFRQRLLRFH